MYRMAHWYYVLDYGLCNTWRDMYNVLCAINYSCKRQMELNIGQNTHNDTTGAGRMQIWKIIMHYSYWWSSQWSSQWYYYTTPCS